jgi:hypothetical protein
VTIHPCRRDTAADFETEVVPLLSQGADYFDASKMTLESFRVAASWIGSRAFGVDDYHGTGPAGKRTLQYFVGLRPQPGILLA